MSAFSRGRADYLELGDWNAVCFQCGRKRKASTLLRHWQGYYVCPEHWEPRQPQDFVRAINDVQTPPWVQPMPADSFGQASLASNSATTTAASGGAVTTTLLIVDIPWSAAGSIITGLTLTDYVSVPTSGIPKVIINVPEGVTVTTSFTLGSTWPVGTEFVVNNHGSVTVIPTWPTNTNITINGSPLGNHVTSPSYTLQWNFGPFPAPVLLFEVQPSDVAVDTAINPAIQVWVVGNLSVAITDVVWTVTLEIYNNAGDPAGVLSGTTVVSTTSGVATFSDLQINEQGTGYTLVASVPGTLIEPKVSNTFNVTGDKATGGVKSTSGAYTIHTFTTSGTFTTLVANLVVDYLLVGGGGACQGVGGGGGGGLSYVTSHTIVSKSANTVTVGAGSIQDDIPKTAGSTTFITTVLGGGDGGAPDGTGVNGACGGGGGFPSVPGMLAGGTGSLGGNGGTGITDVDGITTGGGGGGGMGGIGTNGSVAGGGTGGNGGDGVANSISGASVTYAAGGGGAGFVQGTDGAGFGNPGSGGGVGGVDGQNGIVIVRYLT